MAENQVNNPIDEPIKDEAKEDEMKQERFASPAVKFQMPGTLPFMPPNSTFNPMIRPMGMGMMPPLPHPLILKIQNEPLGTPTATVYV